MIEGILFFLIILIGGVIQSSTGFGFAIFAMSLLPIIMPFKTAVIAVLCASIVMMVSIVIKLRKSINYKLMLWPVISAMFGRWIGITILTTADEKILFKMLAVILIAFAAYFTAFSERTTISPGRKNGMIAGTISGVLGGLANVGGPPLVAYFYSVCDDKEEYMASIQATFLISGLSSFAMNAAYGNITFEVLKLSLIGSVAILIGSYIGLNIFKLINQIVLRRLINSFMVIMGVIMLIKY
ncbi:sulfite exporter TauE/SafE family protein [Alkalibacter saccharofermentans]|uniref:Probable membrane transporter protein n=1 Tax=Alkalibacter saccharofermentans DSM 14828 TaxID=1120975 RepID=A0A1M4U5H9_9FIRM|nr:sulfite exporter TauE/SafE family protein [Alkalibacter saccharofermentans]SHE51923.1 hypothetical protein SAMN02746064_00649 [Alkalibacter saccharofermentans DSM 14828]